MDYVLSFGERMSAFCLAHLLCASGVPACFVDARIWMRTNHDFGMAVVDFKQSQKNVLELSRSWKGKVAVHTGFIASAEDGKTTTLGRNGSDYTATILGSCLGAQKVVINTDISGVYTADPRIVTDAYPVPNLTYREALELATYGSSMFHPRRFNEGLG